MFWQMAHAQGTAAPQGDFTSTLFMMLIFFAVMYFFILRPQAKRAKAHAETLASLKRGDEVVTAGGIYGKIDGLTDEFVTLEVSDGVKIKVVRRQISNKLKEPSK